MTFASELRDMLGSNADVKDFVLERIYPQTMPKAAGFPAIVYTVITAVPATDLDGHNKGLWENRVQIDCYGTTYDEAHDLADAVKAALPNKGTTLSCVLLNQTDLFEEQKRVPRVSMDFSVRWTQA